MKNENAPQSDSLGAFNLQLFAEESTETADTSGDNGGGGVETEVIDQVAEDADKAEGEQAQNEQQETKPDLLADYTPTFPEGFTANDELINEFIPAAKEYGLNPEQANKMVELGSKVAQSTAEKVVKDINEQCEKGYKEFIDGFKGADAKKDLGNANSLIEKYGGKEAVEAFHTAMTGAIGFSPDSVKPFFNAIVKMGKDFADPEFKLGQAAPQNKSLGEILYGDTMK